MSILLLANTDWYLANFRMALINALVERGERVLAVSPAGPHVHSLRDAGCQWREWRICRRGLNPWGEWNAIRELAHIYREEQPRLIHHFTIKCVLYGSVAAKMLRGHSPVVVNSITGLGTVFLSQNPIIRAIRPGIAAWYRLALSRPNSWGIFQNRDDQRMLSGGNGVITKRSIVTAGSGVDLVRFKPTNRASNEQPVVLFAGRLLRDKGIVEFVDASRTLAERGVNAKFLVAGDVDPGNRSSISADQLAEWKQTTRIEFLGHVERMDELIATSDLVVLPSYREGTPRVLLEAAACGKPIVTTDVPGCREIVSHGDNGLLVPRGDVSALSTAMHRMIDNPDLRARFGQRSRELAVEQFDEDVVTRQTLAIYDRMLKSTLGVAG